MVLEIQPGPGDFWVHDHRSLVGQGFNEGTRKKEWRRGPSPGVTMGSAWVVQCIPTMYWSLTGHRPCPHSAPHRLCLYLLQLTQHSKCGWIWKVLSVSIYFLFQTLGILTFIIWSHFMPLIRKNKFIYTDFISNKEIRHHYSVHMKQRQG